MEIDHEIFSTVILSLPLIQEGHLSVSGKRMCNTNKQTMPSTEISMSGILGKKLDLKGKFIPKYCKSCKILGKTDLGLFGDLGLNTD